MNLSPGSSEQQEGAAFPISSTPSPLLCLREGTAAFIIHLSAPSAVKELPNAAFSPKTKWERGGD